MYAFPNMLRVPAESAGIEVPEDTEHYKPADFPHWFVYVTMQLGASLPYPNAAFDNAKLIASYDAEKITHVTPKQLIEDGFAVGVPVP